MPSGGMLAALFRSAPGILAKGMEGRRQGQMQQRKIQQEEEELARAQERQQTQDALAQSLMGYREETSRREAENDASRLGLDTRRLDDSAAEREAARQAREAERLSDREARTAASTEQRNWQAEQQRQQREFQAQQNQLGRQVRLDAAGISQQQPKKRLPAGDADRIGTANALIDLTNKARETFKALPKNSSATGPIDYWMGRAKSVFGAEDPENTKARQAIANINTTLIQARSGAAVTPSEFERLRSMVPSEQQDEQTVRDKLDGLEAELRLMMNSKLNAYEDTGYDVANVRQRLGGGQPAADDDDDDEILKKHLQKLAARRKP